MQIAIVTLFPELFGPFLQLSFVGRAIERGALRVHLEDMRRHGIGKHLSVDDTPYGGGSGMLMRPDTTVAAIEAAESALASEGRPRRVLLTPQGVRFDQSRARALAECESSILVCGRYEGFDERVRHFVDEELSLGDFVLTGGEVAAMAVVEACIRLLPGVLGNAESIREESFSAECGGLLEYPQYTRPVSFRDLEVPEILRSGDHEKVRAWRAAAATDRTRARRPELLTLGEEARGGKVVVRRVAAALVHYPVLDRQRAVVTSAITNLDLHDISRSAHTFGLSDLFIVHPVAAQRLLAERVREHWTSGSGARRIPDRTPAIGMLRIVSTLDDAVTALGDGTELWVTSASGAGQNLDFHAAREALVNSGPPVLIVFGTGWGLGDAVTARASARLPPVRGAREDGYNHLSVRAAAAIIFDRLLSPRD